MEMLEYALVALIVVGCAISSAWRLMSARLRLRLLKAIPEAVANASGGWVMRLRQKTLGQLSGGCGACSSGPHSVNPSVNATFPPSNRKPAAPRR
jgi:hypothetical protein